MLWLKRVAFGVPVLTDKVSVMAVQSPTITLSASPSGPKLTRKHGTASSQLGRAASSDS